MYSLRRSASRLLSTRPASLVSQSRTYASFNASSVRIARRSNPIYQQLQQQRRWATTGEKAPIVKEEPTPKEEAENAAQSGNKPAIAETANATEATEEALPAAETNESLTAETDAAPEDSRPAVAETANATEATEETIPAAETGERVADAPYGSPRSGGQAPPLFSRKPTLYIGNLFFDVTETDLVKEFARFGTVTKCRIVRDARGLSKGFAYVDYSTQEAADAAMERLNMQLFEGRRITVQYAARSSSSMDSESRPPRDNQEPRNQPSKTLFIGNMSFEMTDRDLSNLFRGIRNVIDVRVAIDRRTGQPRGFAHADFIDVKSAMDAMKALQAKEIYGRKLRVDYSFNSASRAPRNEPGNEPAAPPPFEQE